MMNRKNIVTLAILGLGVVSSCKQPSSSKTKDATVSACSDSQSRIDQAIKDLKSRNAPIPADTTPSANSTSTDTTNDTPDSNKYSNFGLSGTRDCSAEGNTAWTNCMTQKCIAYANANPGGWWTSATDCSSATAVNAAKTAGKINDTNASCANAQAQVLQSCSQQNSATAPLTYVCTTRKGANGQTLNQWRLKSEADASNLSYLPNNIKVVQPGDAQAQSLNNTECANAQDPQSANNGANANTPGGISAAQNTADIARFTQNLATARSDLQVCLAKEKAKQNANSGGGAGGGGGGSAVASPTPTAAAGNMKCGTGTTYDGQGQYYPSSTECKRMCKDGYYAGNDGRCYPQPTKSCVDGKEYLGVDGKCYPLGDKKPGTETSCPDGKVLTTMNTCVDDSKYRVPDGQPENYNP